jgi:hypothetical protein
VSPFAVKARRRRLGAQSARRQAFPTSASG